MPNDSRLDNPDEIPAEFKEWLLRYVEQMLFRPLDKITGQLAEAQTPLTTKGDLLSTNGLNLGRLAVGANNTVLFSDSNQTLGIKWAEICTRSTTFPASPDDGDLHVYPADTTNGIMWMFMYRSAVDDWEFVGGSPLYAEVETAETTASTSYAALATAGPSIALPFVGDWIVEIGCTSSTGTPAAQQFMSYDIGGTAATDADCASAHGESVADTRRTQYRKRRKAGLTAVTLTSKYRVDASTGTFLRRWISVTPIRYTPDSGGGS